MTTLCWGLAGLRFELSTSLGAAVLEGESLFSCWEAAPPADSGGVCRWALAREGGKVAVSGGPCSALCRNETEALAAVEAGAVMAVLDHPAAPPALHAALVDTGSGGAVALLGRRESGKSTLALWLWLREGMRLLCDDWIVLDERPGRARPVPRRVSARSSSRAVLGEECWERIAQSPQQIPTEDGFLFRAASQTRQPEPLPLRAVFLLQRLNSRTAPGVADPVAPEDAVFAIAPYCSARNRGMGAAIRAAARLAGSVPVFDLGRDRPEKMAAALNKTLSALG